MDDQSVKELKDKLTEEEALNKIASEVGSMDDDVKENKTEEVDEKPAELKKMDPPGPVAHIKHMKEIAIASIGIAVLAVFALVAFFVMDREESNYEQTSSNEVIEEPEEKLVELASAITIIEGTVEKSEDGQTWSTAAAGDNIKVGEYLRTLNDSRAVMLLDDGSAIRLAGNSQVKLSVSDANTTDIMLISGEVYARVVESDTRTFAVVTENERFVAKGTAYSTSTDGTKDDLEVYQSKVLVDSQNLDVDEGNKYDTGSKEKTSLDLDKLTDDEFISWNKEQDEKNTNFKDKLGVLDIAKVKEEVVEPVVVPTPNPPAPAVEPVVPAASISLSGSKSDKGVNLSWSLSNGASANDGFKIVYDKFSFSPVYGVHTSQYVGAGDRSGFIKLQNGATYNFRVCAYRPATASCDTYSNTVTVTAPVVQVEQVQAGAVNLAIDGRNLSWSIAGTAPHGFKVTLNSTGSPLYPANSIQYVGAGSASYQLPEKPTGTYYVRICKYTADSTGCTDYSNEVQYIVE